MDHVASLLSSVADIIDEIQGMALECVNANLLGIKAALYPLLCYIPCRSPETQAPGREPGQIAKH